MLYKSVQVKHIKIFRKLAGIGKLFAEKQVSCMSIRAEFASFISSFGFTGVGIRGYNDGPSLSCAAIDEEEKALVNEGC